MAEKWNAQTTIKFIEEFKSHECLWNAKHSSYKNKHMREAAYQKIVVEMAIDGFNVAEVKNKMRNLKSTYYQEKKKIEKSKSSGSSGDNVYVPNIKWFTEMNALLKDSDERRKTIDNVSIVLCYNFLTLSLKFFLV